MKTGIHPNYRVAKISCASCGTVYETRTSIGDINIEICAACHPFFTGKSKLVDTTGRVDKFKKKYKMQ
ncbi:50S ribosomal protein L31 [Leptospira tipperaryensis]|uniref:Large ribosomal subunit protein bL31 n=1 Tax=Leptospira tipperaryensis TaxID=2564040 RepID=A0A1D7UV51_9LEPT|nr:50S ribosomal protein L31 [Leptospira tipperaryensis]AOP33466.1 50S ribosomal protein L31 [Leptospira tipperaryensis]